MLHLRQLQDGIDFIEAHLESDFELADVARAAGLSQWHFQRIFKALTHETLKTYIRSRRFANALEQLASTRLSVLDIALAAGYETQESFTRAFKDCFRLTPSQYRSMGNRSLFVRKIRLDESYLAHPCHNVSLEPQIEARPAMRMVGLPTDYYGIDSEKNTKRCRCAGREADAQAASARHHCSACASCSDCRTSTASTACARASAPLGRYAESVSRSATSITMGAVTA